MDMYLKICLVLNWNILQCSIFMFYTVDLNFPSTWNIFPHSVLTLPIKPSHCFLFRKAPSLPSRLHPLELPWSHWALLISGSTSNNRIYILTWLEVCCINIWLAHRPKQCKDSVNIPANERKKVPGFWIINLQILDSDPPGLIIKWHITFQSVATSREWRLAKGQPGDCN